jgi:hypothetical protein
MKKSILNDSGLSMVISFFAAVVFVFFVYRSAIAFWIIFLFGEIMYPGLRHCAANFPAIRVLVKREGERPDI